jgi:probable phosphoglycerate mutase
VTGGSPTPLIPEGLDATLVLLRHGESELIREGRFQGQAETPLSDVGRRQAALAAERLAAPHASPMLPIPGGRPLEIVHSPLARTAETAALVAAAIGAGDEAAATLPVRPEPGLLEIGQGDWEGETHDEIARRWSAELAAWRRRPDEAWAPGGESLGEVQSRARPALATILEQLGRDYPRGSLDRPQVGGYRGAGLDASQPWSVIVGHDGLFKVVLLTLFDIPLSRFWTFSFALCGISIVEFRGGRAVLRAHNLTEHLAPMLDEEAQAEAEARTRSGAL